MLQWLYAYVASVCSKCFIYFFQTYVASVFIWMLHIFHTYVASVLSGYCVCMLAIVFNFFKSALDACFECFICIFCMLKVLHLDVLKVDRVLHKGCVCEAREGASSPHAGDFRAARVIQARSSHV